MNISIIIPYRNRSLDRVKTLVESFRKQQDSDLISLEFILSDFGSTAPSHERISEFCIENNIRHIVSFADGLPWSRAHAINNGVRNAQYEWICIVDVDMVLLDPLFNYFYAHAHHNTVFFLESIWQQKQNQTIKKGVINRSYGVFQFIHISWFNHLNGLDERIEFWGGEDFDWVRRLTRHNIQIEWLLAKQFRLVHMWHETDSLPHKRPQTAIWQTLSIELENAIKDPIQPGWGQLLLTEQRPVLALKETDFLNTQRLQIPVSGFLEYVSEIIKILKQQDKVLIDIGPRRISRKLSFINGWYRLLRRPLEAFALQLSPLINTNLESFLLSRKAMHQELSDYYLSENLDQIMLVSRKLQR